MKLVVKGKGVGYGVNGADVAITSIANVNTLKEGSIIIAHDNGTIVKADGTFTSDAGSMAIIYAMVKGELISAPPIMVGRSKLMYPLTSKSPVKKVVTFSILKPTTITEGSDTGLSFIDPRKNDMDPSRRKDITIYVDEDSVQTDFNALEAKVAALDFVESVSLSSNTLSITYVQGANIHLSGMGEFEKRSETVTAKSELGSTISKEEMVKFAKAASAMDGNSDTDIAGVQGMFTKDYGIEDSRYLIYGFGINTDVYSTGKTDRIDYGAANYIAIPDGDIPATGESWADLFEAVVSGVPGTVAE